MKYEPAGLLDIDTHLSTQIFIDEKPAYYDFSNHTDNMTGTEVFEHFNSDQ